MAIEKLQYTDLNGFKLLIASISTGNVGQLTAVLLTDLLNMDRYALVYNTSDKPILQPINICDYERELEIYTEFYVCERKKVVLMNFMNPMDIRFNASLMDEIPYFVRSEGIIEIIQLSSAYDFENYYFNKTYLNIVPGNLAPDFEKSYICSQSSTKTPGNRSLEYEYYCIVQHPFEYLANKNFKISKSLTSNFNKAIDESISGCGYAMKFHSLATILKIPSVILLKYSIGDYRADVIKLTEKVLKYLDNQ